jgi:NitT/TauT family transport system permease protein
MAWVRGRPAAAWVSLALFLALMVVLGYGAVRLVMLLTDVSGEEWAKLPKAALATLARVLVSTALGTLWAVPAGLMIGLSPRLSRALQPVVQVLASFPAPMLFPIVVYMLHFVHVTLNWGSVLLMLLGTQWYILFNVIAGAMAIPADLREMSRSYNIRGWRRFCLLYLPAIFPYLVTGWVTAAGGAWNASIVSEYIPDETPAWGIGALISEAAEAKQFPLLAASVLVMAALVVTFNRTVWRRLYRVAERKYSLSK